MNNPYADEDRDVLYLMANEARKKYVGKTLHIEDRVDVDNIWEFSGKVADVFVDINMIIIRFEDGTFIKYEVLEYAHLDIT